MSEAWLFNFLFQVDFQLDVVTIELFSDSSRLLPLSKLELLRLKTNLTMRNDESMNANFAFGELALDDARKSSAGGITKLIRNKVQEAGNRLLCACESFVVLTCYAYSFCSLGRRKTGI